MTDKPETTTLPAADKPAKAVKTAKYNAPAHTTQIHLTIGTVDVKDGQIEVPAELSPGDIAGLAANGFTLA